MTTPYLEELQTRLARIRAGRRALGAVDKTTDDLLSSIQEIEAYVEAQIAEEIRKSTPLRPITICR